MRESFEARRACDAAQRSDAVRDIGVLGALSIGVGGIVGGGFFATFGLAVVGARGSTYLSFLLGGVLALLTAYSYVRLTLRYPGPAGTAGFIRQAFGVSLLPASINVLLIYSYIAVMAVYALALAAYAASYFPADHYEAWVHLLSSGAIILLGFINFAGAAAMAKFESVFNIGKLMILGVFIVAGFTLGRPDWGRLGTENWVSTNRIVSSGIIVFLAYEGFELISNASAQIRNPERTLPIALYGSVAAAIVIYVLAIIVAVGHMPFEAMKNAQSFALSATAQQFMGSFGFGLMTLGAVLASASAINADFFGASKLPVMLSEHGEMPERFSTEIKGKHVASMLFVGVIALVAVNFVGLAALSAATSAGFLVVYAAVNIANAKLAPETRSLRAIPVLAAIVCVVALGVTAYDFAIEPETRISAFSMFAIILLSVGSEKAFRVFWPAREQATEDRLAERARMADRQDDEPMSDSSLNTAFKLAATLVTLGAVAGLVLIQTTFLTEDAPVATGVTTSDLSKGAGGAPGAAPAPDAPGAADDAPSPPPAPGSSPDASKPESIIRSPIPAIAPSVSEHRPQSQREVAQNRRKKKRRTN